jgi:hypothetical protein
MKKDKRISLDKITEKIQSKLKIEFEEKQFPLKVSGSVDIEKWGIVDRCHVVNSNKYIFLEIEKGQSHPDTNVSKVWPYLRKNDKVHIFLIQVFFTECLGKCKSRVLLSEWIGNELEKQFHRRFHYFKIVFNGRNMNSKKRLNEEYDRFLRYK